MLSCFKITRFGKTGIRNLLRITYTFDAHAPVGKLNVICVTLVENTLELCGHSKRICRCGRVYLL